MKTSPRISKILGAGGGERAVWTMSKLWWFKFKKRSLSRSCQQFPLRLWCPWTWPEHPGLDLPVCWESDCLKNARLGLVWQVRRGGGANNCLRCYTLHVAPTHSRCRRDAYAHRRTHENRNQVCCETGMSSLDGCHCSWSWLYIVRYFNIGI